MHWRTVVTVVFVLVSLAVCDQPSIPIYPDSPEILWDTWGVPHVYAADAEGLFRAFGWAQMRSHGDLILKLYGQARGKAAEYWGEPMLDSDRWVRTMGVYSRAREWYGRQSPAFRRLLDAFAAGMNEYAQAHRESIAEEARVVLPVDAVDVLAHAHRVIYFTFVSSPDVVGQAERRLATTGSNAWAIGPTHAESGNTMLLINPHLPWQGEYLFYEAHLVAPGVDFYGATLVGFPVLALGFNENLGWSHTVNTYDGADSYELALEGEGYRFDGVVRRFEEEEQIIRVRQSNGTVREERWVVRRSVHGPVVAQVGTRAVAHRVAGLDQPGMLEQWWDMMRASSVSEFEAILARLEIPMFNVIYADREGHILYVFNGSVPKRAKGDFLYWYGLVPGDTSETLWTETHPYADLPRLLDPESGWLQNANDPPWTSTLPPALDPGDFPAYMAPAFMHFRAQQSARLLLDDPQISFEELVRYKHSTRMLLADRFLDDLIPAAREYGSEIARSAADVLEAWNRSADADSKGAVLFEKWAELMGFGGLFDPSDPRSAELMRRTFAEPWDPKSPHTTPDGLQRPAEAAKVLASAADAVLKSHGSLSVSWGDVYRITYAGRNLGANGGPGDPMGLFRAAYFRPGEDGIYGIAGGDTFYAAVEFSRPVRARVLLAYGNATQPGSPHVGDQLGLFAANEMRVAWRAREDIEAHLESRESLGGSGN